SGRSDRRRRHGRLRCPDRTCTRGGRWLPQNVQPRGTSSRSHRCRRAYRRPAEGLIITTTLAPHRGRAFSLGGNDMLRFLLRSPDGQTALTFVGLGLAVAWGATSYNVGTPGRM